MVAKKCPVICPWRLFLALILLFPFSDLLAQNSTRTANAIESAGSWPARCKPAGRNMAFLTTGTVGPGYCSATDTFVSLVPTGGGPPIGGSGTIGKLAKWTAARTLGNSFFSESSTDAIIAPSGAVNLGATAAGLPGGIRFYGTTSGAVQLIAPAVVTGGPIGLYLPSAQGAAGTFMKNDGSGNLSFGAALTSLGGLTGTSQTLATGTSGTDFAIVSATTTHTFNLPDAGASARGVVTTGTQTFAGSKTFSSAPTFSSLTANSFLFSGAGGIATTTAAPTDGQFLIGVTGGAPVVASLTAGANITLTPGPGSLAIASTGGTAFAVRFVDPYPATTGRAFANVHESAGSGVKHFSGWGVCPGTGADCATTTADTTWELVAWDIPPVLPSGTATLRCWAIANDASGVAKVNWKWNTCASEVDCSGVTLNAEGTSTVTWTTGDADQLKLLDITMDASTLTAGQPVVGKLVFEATGWTETKVSTWNCSIVWLQ
jgi:hypothetical protein